MDLHHEGFVALVPACQARGLEAPREIRGASAFEVPAPGSRNPRSKMELASNFGFHGQ